MRRYLFAMTMLAAPLPAFAAPMVLTGDYIQAGISDAGTFGSNGNADPAFVHDPSGKGSFDPKFDYIAPGVPHDGFSINSTESGFQRNDNDFPFSGNFTTSGGPTVLTGAAARGYANAASWTGASRYASIVNNYFFNDGDERIIVETTITALSDLTNLAFARSVDPDSDSRSFGTSASKNQRGNSLFGKDDFIGSAGAVSGLTLALVNIDGGGFAHTTQINGFCCGNINPYDVLGHTGGDLGDSSVGDHGLNIAYDIGDLLAGKSVTLSYAYAVGERIGDTGGPTEPGAVPEPASWALMIGGVGLAGGQLRRRHRVARPRLA